MPTCLLYNFYKYDNYFFFFMKLSVYVDGMCSLSFFLWLCIFLYFYFLFILYFNFFINSLKTKNLPRFIFIKI